MGSIGSYARANYLSRFEETEDGYCLVIDNLDEYADHLVNTGMILIKNSDWLLLELYKYGFDSIGNNHFTHPMFEGVSVPFTLQGCRTEPPFVTRKRYQNMFEGERIEVWEKALSFHEVLDNVINDNNDLFVKDEQNRILVQRNIPLLVSFWEEFKIPYSLSKFLYSFTDYGYFCKVTLSHLVFHNIFEQYGVDIEKVPKRKTREPFESFKMRMKQVLNDNGVFHVEFPNLTLSLQIPQSERLNLMITDIMSPIEVDLTNGLLKINPYPDLLTTFMKAHNFSSFLLLSEYLFKYGFKRIRSSIDYRFYNPILELTSSLEELKLYTTTSIAKKSVKSILIEKGKIELLSKYNSCLNLNDRSLSFLLDI